MMRLVPTCLAAIATLSSTSAFQTLNPIVQTKSWSLISPWNNLDASMEPDKEEDEWDEEQCQDRDHQDSQSPWQITRRSAVNSILATASTASASSLLLSQPNPASAEESLYAPKFVQTYADFTQTPAGWSYKDIKLPPPSSPSPQPGDRAVFDWSGYTIGYFGRPFEAKGGPQGGAFDKELDYFRTVMGSHTVIPGLEQALATMKVGGIRQVIVPYGELSYPEGDLSHERVGPKPTTFSGMRALNFVLENPRVDRTLLFNVKLVRVDRSDGKGGFVRG